MATGKFLEPIDKDIFCKALSDLLGDQYECEVAFDLIRTVGESYNPDV